MRMDIGELATIAHRGRASIVRFEAEKCVLRADALIALRAEFERRGIVFKFAEDGRPTGIEEVSPP